MADDKSEARDVTSGQWTSRPTFDLPTYRPYSDVSRHIWGDDAAGFVPDWVYVSSDKIHHLMFGLAPGGSFRHSEAVRTLFGADEVFYVLSGTLVVINPEFGEVHRVRSREAVFFRKDTWHHGISFGPEALRVLEFFAPTPRAGASSAYSKDKDLLTDVRYVDDRWSGNWPMMKEERMATATMSVIEDRDLLWSMSGDALVGTYVDTEHLKTAKVILPPGGKTEAQHHRGDLSLQVLTGSPHLLLVGETDLSGQAWFELDAMDGFFVPEGSTYQLHNTTDRSAEVLFGVGTVDR